jgi:hypothetical protein
VTNGGNGRKRYQGGSLGFLRRELLARGCGVVLSFALIVPDAAAQADQSTPAPAPAPAAATEQATESFNPEQLDAMLAPIALYPDTLLVQILMAATYPLQIVEAARWLAADNNKDLKGEDLSKALEPKDWDPSVKSIVPFPIVLQQMDQNLDWTQQLGYAMAVQQDEVMGSVQRLRRQAQDNGQLKSTEQQVVKTEAVTDDQGAPTPEKTIIIQPANPQVVYVPSYNPSVVYGTWPYPAYPPTYYPPPSSYPLLSAFGTGLAFATGVAVVGSLWGWASPGWHGGCCGGGNSINVNRERYNNITVNNPNRGVVNNGNWRPSAQRVNAGARPPRGPVGAPARANGLPANSIGRASVQVPANAINRAPIGGGARAGANPGGANRAALGANAGQNRANVGGGAQFNRAGQGVGANLNRPATTARPTVQPAQRSPQRPSAPARTQSLQRSGGAFGGIRDGSRAGQYQQRGAQSRAMRQRPAGGGRGGGGRR